MKSIKEYITENNFTKKQLEREARGQLLNWCYEFNWDFDKIKEKMDQWYDNDFASRFFDKRKFNNKEVAEYNDYLRELMKDEASLNKFKREFGE